MQPQIPFGNDKQKVKAVVVTAFEPESGPVPGEFTYWRERFGLAQRVSFPQGYQDLWTDGDGVLGIVTGVGTARAAASLMALGMDARFDLTEALFVVSGVAGISPERGSLGSVVLPEFVVDGNLAHEIDAREIPGDWADGFVPIGKSVPYEEPREARFNGDDGIVFRLSGELVEWAFGVAREVELMDSEKMAARRVQFLPAETAHRAPFLLRGDELSSSTYWHGELMSRRASDWVKYQTDGAGDYAVSGMEDSGTLQALTFLGAAGRVVIVRGASNFDRQRVGVTAAESLAETKVVSYSAYLPALENAFRVGSAVVRAWVERA